jgi:hypothetical protein
MDEYQYRDRTIAQGVARAMEPLAIASVLCALISIIGWIIRGIIGHRRWLRVSKLQTDMQNKLLERFQLQRRNAGVHPDAGGQKSFWNRPAFRPKSGHGRLMLRSGGFCGPSNWVSSLWLRGADWKLSRADSTMPTRKPDLGLSAFW